MRDSKKEKRGRKGKAEEAERRTRRGEVSKRGDWAGKRGEMREQRRREEEQADWIFQRSVSHTLRNPKMIFAVFRAKHRKETRQEEQRGDWYFERKQKLGGEQLEEEERRRRGEESIKRDKKPGEKRKGEEKVKRGEKVRKRGKSGDEMNFEEREFHAERHYREGWQRKPEKERSRDLKFSGNDDFHVEADFDYKFNNHH